MSSGKRVVLTMQQRVDILKDLETESIADVAKKHKVNHVTVWRIQQNAITITDFANKGKLERRRKNLKKPTYDELEQRLLVWVIEKRTIGEVLSDALLLQKAAELKEQFGACSNFKISRGWLANFKRRHRIRLVRKERKEEDSDGDKDEGRGVVIKEERDVNIDEGRNEPLMGNILSKNFKNRSFSEEYIYTLVHKSPDTYLQENDNVQLWNEQRDEAIDEAAEEEGNGIELNREEREEIEAIFTCFERYRNRIPHSTRFHLDGLKVTILGNTMPKEEIHSREQC